MRAWFVFVVNGKKIAVFANNTKEAHEILTQNVKEDVTGSEYLGVLMGFSPQRIDRYLFYPGMKSIRIALLSMNDNERALERRKYRR